jgi:hypothetical protein
VDVLVSVEGGDDHDRDGLLDVRARQESGGLDPVQVRHSDVEEAHVRTQFPSERDGLASIGGRPDDVDAGMAAQDRGQTRPEGDLIVGK